jgi:Ca2+-binding EF-hand superfamily protein
MYAHGAKSVDDKGQQAEERKRAQQARQDAAREKENVFNARVRKYSRVRKLLFDVVHKQWFDNFFMLVILMYAVFLGIYDPLSSGDSMPNKFVTAAEPYFTVLFTIDMVAHLGADGFKQFFGDAWNIMDTLFVGLGWLDFFPGMNSGLGMLRCVKLSRILTKVDSMRMVVTALISSIPGLGNVLALVVFMVFIFALLALKIWKGVMQGRCVAAAANTSVLPDALCEAHRLGGLAVYTGPSQVYCDLSVTTSCEHVGAGYVCQYAGNPETGNQGYDNIGMALLTTFQAITSEGWSPVMDALSSASSPGVVYPYFGLLMVFGGLFVTNYLLAECCVVFQGHMSNLKVMAGDKEVLEKEVKKVSKKAMTKVIAASTMRSATKSFGSGEPVDIESPKEKQALLGSPKPDEVQRAEPTMSVLAIQMQPVGGSTNDGVAVLDLQALHVQLSTVSIGELRKRAASMHIDLAAVEKAMDSDDPKHVVVELIVAEHAAQIMAKSSTNPIRRFRASLANAVMAKPVDSFLTVCIVINFIMLAVEHHNMPTWLDDFLSQANIILTIIFTTEMFAKIFAFGFKGYFADVFNCFDAFVVVTSVIELLLSSSGGSVSVLRTLRLVRIMRSLKLIKSGSALRQIIETAIASMQAVANFGVLLLLIMYIYALLGMNLFGGKLLDHDGVETPRGNFDSILSAMIAVFQVATRENWYVHMFAAMRSEAGSFVAVTYFISLLILTNYILLALFMGTLLEKFNQHFSEVSKMDIGVGAMVTMARVKLMKLVRRGRKRPAVAVESSEKSLCLFKASSCLRAACTRIINHSLFEQMVIVAIIVSSLLLAVEHPNDREGTTKALILKILDIAFTIFFTLEMLMKIIAMGFVKGKDTYLKSYWNVLDLTVVIISWLNLFLPLLNPDSGSSTKSLRVLRTVRALRPLQAVKRWPGLRLVLRSIGSSIPSIIIVLMLAVFFMLIFGIFFVQLFKGALHSCDTDEDNVALVGIPKAWCVGNFVSMDGIISSRAWLNHRQNFDNILSALLIMFELLTLEEWNSILVTVVDATDSEHGPKRDNNPAFSLVFVIYIIAGSFFVLNLFVGVIVTSYNEAKRNADQKLETNRNQEERRTNRVIATHDEAWFKYHKLYGASSTGWRKPISKLVLHSAFEWIILVAILLNVCFMALEYSGDYMCPMDSNVESVMQYSNDVFSFVFLGEMLIKLAAFGLKKYASEAWNRFDGFIVTVSMAEFIVAQATDGELPLDPTVVRLFRIFRVARFVRLAEKAKGIKNLIQTFVETLPYLANVAALLSIFIFIYAVVGVAFFTNVKHGNDLTEYANFSNFASAIGLLLRITTGEGWSGTMRDCQIMTGCGNFNVTDADGDVETLNNCGSPLLSPIYFVTYMLVCTYMSLNVIVAVILFTFFDLEGNPEDKSLDGDAINKFLTVCEKHATKETYAIPANSLQALMMSAGQPLGSQTEWHFDQFLAAMQEWMNVEIQGSARIVLSTAVVASEVQRAQARESLLAKAREAFDKADTDGGGTLDADEIAALAGSLGKPLEPFEVEVVLTEMRGGITGEGDISFGQFFEWWEKQQDVKSGGIFGQLFNSRKRQVQKKILQQKEEQEKAEVRKARRDKAREAFDDADLDCSGNLDADEIMALATSLGKALQTSEVNTVLADMRGGIPGEDEISFDQFSGWWDRQQDLHSGGFFGRLFGKKRQTQEKPYAVVYWNGKVLGDTVTSGGVYPDWHSSFDALRNINGKANSLRVEVRCTTKAGGEESIGQINIALSEQTMSPLAFNLSKRAVKLTTADGLDPSDGTENVDASKSPGRATLSLIPAAFDILTDEISVALLLRFLIFYEFGVDVRPPKEQGSLPNVAAPKVAPAPVDENVQQISDDATTGSIDTVSSPPAGAATPIAKGVVSPLPLPSDVLTPKTEAKVDSFLAEEYAEEATTAAKVDGFLAEES